MVAYVEFEIMEGAYEISCPDALCPAQGILSLDEITKLSSSSLIDKHNRYRLNRGTFYVTEFYFYFPFNLCLVVKVKFLSEMSLDCTIFSAVLC